MTGLEFIAAAASAASGVISAIGAIQQGAAAQASAEYNAKVDERNRILADQDRKRALETAAQAADDKGREHKRTLATMRAAYGASGLELAGSPLDVLEDTAIEQALDIARIEDEGRVRNREGALQMLGYTESATIHRAEGKNAKTASYFNAAGSILQGTGKAISRVA